MLGLSREKVERFLRRVAVAPMKWIEMTALGALVSVVHLKVSRSGVEAPSRDLSEMKENNAIKQSSSPLEEHYRLAPSCV